MRNLKRISSIVLIITLIFELGLSNIIFAAPAFPNQPAPGNLRVESPDGSDEIPLGADNTDASKDNYYVNLKWDTLAKPTPDIAEQQYMNIYVQEVNKPYRPPKSNTQWEKDIPVNSATTQKLRGLSSGTFYYINSRAYYTSTTDGTTYTSKESQPSNTVKVLTDIDIDAYSYGANQIKLEWDDVWNLGRRIDYKLYISEYKDFANTMPISLSQAQIGPNGPVKVNEASGKLEYIHTVNYPGRIYYVKIVPDIAEANLVKNDSSKTVAVSSYILVKTSKMSTTESGTIWRLDWSKVGAFFSDNDVNVTYEIDKFVNDAPIPILLESGTTTFITVPQGQEGTYYMIRAIFSKNGVEYNPDNIKIVSDKILVKDQEIPANPPAPEIVNELDDFRGDPIITYADKYDTDGRLIKKGELKPNSAAILIRLPRKADGSEDTDVVYDIWKISDPNLLDSPPNYTKIASNYKMDAGNRVLDEATKTGVGYKFIVDDLTPNSTYYIKVVAKKFFIENVDNEMSSVEYTSLPGLKTVITPSEGPIDQPLVPARPPLKVKKTPQGKDMITTDQVTIQLKNKWYEKFDENTGKWEYIRTEKLNVYDVPPYIPTTPLNEKLYRMVEYDPGANGVTIDVGCKRIEDVKSYSELESLAANKITGFAVTANDPEEDRMLNPDGQRHNIDITITGLEPNTTYVVWVRASRKSVNLTSGPSDPIIITTGPEVTIPIEKPIVPVFNYNHAGDNYVDLGWDFKPNYNYYIKYGTKDDINAAEDTIKIAPEDLLFSTFQRIEELKSDTVYYFWIKAEVEAAGDKSESEWSDSFSVKTLPDLPPDAPNGFGVKNAKDAVTKDSITFEWVRDGELEYIIEISDNADYKSSQKIEAGNTSEFKVDGLKSNRRYYARLFAFDPDKELTSEPAPSIVIRTEKSNDEFDSDQETENVITGDYIEKAPTVERDIWNIKIVGVNADRFIEHVSSDKALDYKIDALRPPSKAKAISVLISNRVIEALSGLKENLIISAIGSEFVIRPEMLDRAMIETPSQRFGKFDYEIVITSEDTKEDNSAKNLTFKTPVIGVGIIARDGSRAVPVNVLNRPLRLMIPYSAGSWYREGSTSAYIYNSVSAAWEKAATVNTYDVAKNKGYLSIDALKTGNIVVADMGKNYYDDIYGKQCESSITNIASNFQLKSVKGRLFRPESYTVTADAAKIVLDILGVKYNNNHISTAVKAGILSSQDASKAGGSLSRGKAMLMAVRLYELKSGQTAKAANFDSKQFKNIKGFDTKALTKVSFAMENGLTVSNDIKANPLGDPVTRGEFMIMLERSLVLSGELN